MNSLFIIIDHEMGYQCFLINNNKLHEKQLFRTDIGRKNYYLTNEIKALLRAEGTELQSTNFSTNEMGITHVYTTSDDLL